MDTRLHFTHTKEEVMSGGSFDYGYEKINYVYDEIDSFIKNLANDAEENKIKPHLRNIMEYLKLLAEVTKSAEWYTSADTSLIDFEEDYYVFEEKVQVLLNKGMS